MSLSPGRVSVPNSFVSLFVFYILSYLLSKRADCLSGCLVSSASIQKLFCGSCSAFKWSFDEFVGEKVVSLSYSSAILGRPPSLSIMVFSGYIPSRWIAESVVKNLPACHCRKHRCRFNPWVWEIPWGGHSNPFQCSFWWIPWIEESGGLHFIGS